MSTPGLIPDGTNWIDAYGRTWTAHGDDLLLWSYPVVVILGENPQKMAQGGTYVEHGATATDATGADLTGSIIIDSSAVDVNTPGSYTVTYTVTDSEGYTTVEDREVLVLDVNRPDVRDIIYDLIDTGLPDGMYVYRTPVDQLKSPAVVIGTMDWVPGRMANLDKVDWEITIVLLIQRGLPAYSTFSLETISLKVAQLLKAGSFQVQGFTDEGMTEVGGVSYLSGSLNLTYKETDA